MADFKLTYSTMFNPPEELHKGFDKAVGKLKQKCFHMLPEPIVPASPHPYNILYAATGCRGFSLRFDLDHRGTIER